MSSGSLACPKCSRPYLRREALLEHLSISRSCGDRRDAHRCPRCGAGFPHRSKLAEHVKSTRACHIRLQRARLESLLSKESKEEPTAEIPQNQAEPNRAVVRLSAKQPVEDTSETGKEHLECDKCSSKFASRKSLVWHERDSASCGEKGKALACPRCSATFPSGFRLARHQGTAKGCVIQRKRADLEAQLLTGKQLDEQAASPSSNDVVSCPKCSRIYRSRKKLQHHLNYSAECGSMSRRFPCPNCDVAFPLLCQLARHRDSGIACGIQQRRSKLQSLVAEASRGKDEMEGEEGKQRSSSLSSFGGLSCRKCSRTYPSAKKLEYHLSYSAKCGGERSRRFPCGKCGFAFARLSQLAEHRASARACRVQLQRRKLQLLIAEGAKTAEGKLKSEDELPMTTTKCPKCQKEFASVLRLKDHLSVSRTCGIRSRKLTCDKCGSAFLRAKSLREHKASQNGCKIVLRRRELGQLLEQAKDETSKIYEPGNDASKEVPIPRSPQCPKCETTFAPGKSLREHLYFSKICGTKDKPFPCAKCGSSFSQARRLREHEQSRLGCQLALRRRELAHVLARAAESGEASTEAQDQVSQETPVGLLESGEGTGEEDEEEGKELQEAEETEDNGQMDEEKEVEEGSKEIETRQTELVAEEEPERVNAPAKAPVILCAKCGDIFPSHIRLNIHKRRNRACR